MALNESEVAQIRRAGEHFKKVLRDTFAELPRSAVSIAGLAKWTGVNKSTCQRFVQALTKSHDGIDVIVTLPGVNGLRKLAERLEQLLESPERLQGLNQLVAQYQELILEYASSQSELKRLLHQSQLQSTQSLGAYNRIQRKNAFETNKELTGESVDVYLGIHYVRLNPENKNYIDELIIANKQGVELSKAARPFVQNFGGNLGETQLSDPVLLDAETIGKFSRVANGEYLFKEFSTPDIERCYAGVGNLKNSLIFDHTQQPVDCRKFDITLAHMDVKTQPEPVHNDYKILCQSLVQRSPAKRLILISFLERQLAKASSVQAGCYPSSMKIHERGHQPEDLWSERFSESPEIKLFNPEQASLSQSLQLPYLDALTSFGCNLLNQSPEEFVGYYIDIEYPMWLTSHRFYFEFG